MGKIICFGASCTSVEDFPNKIAYINLIAESVIRNDASFRRRYATWESYKASYMKILLTYPLKRGKPASASAPIIKPEAVKGMFLKRPPKASKSCFPLRRIIVPIHIKSRVLYSI